jgi:hypothetical protein
MRADSYRFLKRLGDGLVVLDCGEYGEQLWSQTKTRKPFRCALCNKDGKSGDEAFRPLTNAHNRMERIHTTCLRPIIEAFKGEQ